MAGEQVFHNLLLIGDGLGGSAVDDHALADGGLAGGHELGDPLDFDKTDAAGCDHRQSRVVAIAGHGDAVFVTGVEDQLLVSAFKGLSVNGDLWHMRSMI